jgi:uncharacterized protein (TIGR02117 family)
MKKAFKLLLKTILGIILFLASYLTLEYVLSSITVHHEPSAAEEVTIHILTNGVHTDIVVPATGIYDWTKLFKYENTQSKDSTLSYLALGWGDKGFYLDTPTWADLKASTAFKAAFGLSTTAIHATYYDQMPESESCKKMKISKEQYQKLITYVLETLDRNADGGLQNIQTKSFYNKTDAFYEANGAYSMLFTCNSWANKGLKTIGQKSCLWAAFDTRIFKKYELEE